MRFIPHVDRPRRRRISPPPPPPQVLINQDPIQIPLPTSPVSEIFPVRPPRRPPGPPPPPPPPPPAVEPPPITHVQLALIGALNPFLPRREIPRSPPIIRYPRNTHNVQLENSLSLFRR